MKKGSDFQEILSVLEKEHGVVFSYASSIIPKPQEFVLGKNFEMSTIQEVLDYICARNHLVWVTKSDQVVIRKAALNEQFYYIQGIVREEVNNKPVPYASICMKQSSSGAAADGEGEFELRIAHKELDDTLLFSFLGYRKQEIPIREMLRSSFHTIILKESSFSIAPVEVRARKLKTKELGNSGGIAMGSLYLDTHGQQTALLIENEKHTAGGYIASVKFYLSKKGNTEAPFRVRLYSIDSINGKPGKDMLREVVIVKPENIKKGWYEVNLRQYGLTIPNEGFYVAMQGVYPEDYEVNLEGFDSEEATETEEPDISYGQRLGYTKSKKNRDNTWHYSLSHTWFQLKSQSYGVMISAEIKYER